MKGLKVSLLVITSLALLGLPSVAAAGGKVAVVVVDVQADFTKAHKGSLAVNGTDQAYLKQVVKATAQLKKAGLPIYATQDWHPKNHMSFASNQPGKKPFQAIKLADGRTQVLWPNHCVQGSAGAGILLDKALFTKVVRKGMNPKYDSYSGFKDDGGAKTGLDKSLKAAGVGTLIVYGIATDYCVKATVMDGLAAGFKVVVVQDLCRGVALKTSQAAWKAMKKAGAVLWPSLDLAKAKKL
ncbi:MAG: bifunctional nicotinamidase/pyrazinamidase [Proteobacteria bacterium]|nr:bifunctional nicotinamidase/pyrazinamidase [Pseudomonadota bacterium]MBU1739910.1 bifunctional nicotinamidase/pyrazinamidase [Pseudomonadota bacterium]